MDKLTKDQQVNLLVFRLKNIFKNDQYESYYTRKDLFDLFIHEPNHRIIKALNILVEKRNIEGFTLNNGGNKLYYSYKSIQTRARNFDNLINEIDSEMTFGIEFEFGSKIKESDLEDMLEEAGFEVTRIGLGIPRYSKWEVTHDTSIDVINYIHDVEIISPVLKGKEGLKELHKMTRFLNTLKKIGLIKQNISCGTHVHHSAKKYTPLTKLINLMEKSQHIMNQFVSPCRARDDEFIKICIDEIYCSPVVKQKYFDGRKIKSSHDKYLNLNVSKYKDYGTVEFRQLQGITNFRKIAAWIIMAQKIIKNSKQHAYFDSIEGFCDFLKIKEVVLKGLAA